MSDYECIHCGEIDYHSNHWEACKKHPARKIINELVDEIKQLENELDLSRKQIEANKALFEICANAIIQHYQALEDDLPAKAESFLQELLKALYIYCPKESADGTFSKLAREMRLHIFTFKD